MIDGLGDIWVAMGAAYGFEAMGRLWWREGGTLNRVLAVGMFLCGASIPVRVIIALFTR